MRIEILKNKETSLVIDDIGKSIYEDGILGEGYKKAISALDRYVRQTERIRTQMKSDEISDSQTNDILYQFAQNIIAFSGKRGTGKTSAMLSFAEFLKEQGKADAPSEKLWKDHYQGMRMLVLSPIDPTMLENNDNILNVVLSRLLYKAEERWEYYTGIHHSLQNLEREKNDLLRKASACLNGIRAIKREGDIDSLAALQKIGDSAVLKKNLFDLVDLVNHFCLGDCGEGNVSAYLVIPIDDTDCQIRKAHEVMEDIRRYLTIPNVLILMATDGEMLRTDFAQHYASAFKTGIERSFLIPNDMEQYAEKYLTKLIPGTHRVYMPVFENVLKEKSVTLELGYYENSDRDRDLISGSLQAERERKRKRGDLSGIDFDFQAKVLQFIYQKTGIVFLEHSTYMNNVIPTTMRGLSHLLNFLESMEEVPEIDYSSLQSQKDFLQAAGSRFAAIEKNLDLFEEYFLNEWVPAKIPGKMAKDLKEIDEQVPKYLIQYVYDELLEGEKPFEDEKGGKGASYYDLMDLLGGRNGTVDVAGYVGRLYRHKTDFYYSFAIRTLISIKKNKWAVRIRQRALEAARKNQTGASDYGMSFSPDALNDLFPSVKTERGTYGKMLMPVVEAYRSLLLDEIKLKRRLNARSRCQVQELAWIVLCNWDVQETIFKSVEKYQMEAGWSKSDLWEDIRSAIAARNCRMLDNIVRQGAVKIKEWPEFYLHLLEADNNTNGDSPSPELSDYIETVRNMIRDLDSRIENRGGIYKDVLLDCVDGIILSLRILRQNNLASESDEEKRMELDIVYAVAETFIAEGNAIKEAVENEKGENDQSPEQDSEENLLLKLNEDTKERIRKWTTDISYWLTGIAALG